MNLTGAGSYIAFANERSTKPNVTLVVNTRIDNPKFLVICTKVLLPGEELFLPPLASATPKENNDYFDIYQKELGCRYYGICAAMERVKFIFLMLLFSGNVRLSNM